MDQQRPPHGFEAVDQDDNPSWFRECLDTQSALPFHQAVTQAVFERLQVRECFHVVDVGCGTGTDAQALAQMVGPSGRVVGIDISETLIAEARARSQDQTLPVEIIRGDATSIPLESERFDGCFSIRTFQHLAEPQHILAEMFRILRPGGRVVVADPDHTSAVVDVVERDIAQRFLMWRADTIRNGWIAHHMHALMKEVGFQEVDVTPMVNMRTDYAEVERTSHYEGGVRVAQREGVFTEVEADSLIASFRAAATDSFFCAMTFFITSGTKP